MHVVRIVCIRLIAGRQVFAGMSIAPNDVGHAGSMIVRSIAIDALRIPVRIRRKHLLYVIPAARKIRKHVSIINTTT